jgi:hypothetical protein
MVTARIAISESAGLDAPNITTPEQSIDPPDNAGVAEDRVLRLRDTGKPEIGNGGSVDCRD